MIWEVGTDWWLIHCAQCDFEFVRRRANGFPKVCRKCRRRDWNEVELKGMTELARKVLQNDRDRRVRA